MAKEVKFIFTKNRYEESLLQINQIGFFVQDSQSKKVDLKPQKIDTAEKKDESVNINLEALEKGWFCVQYFDFHGGDIESAPCSNYDEACKMIMSKPKQSDIAHSHVEGTLYSKAVDRGSVLTIKKWKPG